MASFPRLQERIIVILAIKKKKRYRSTRNRFPFILSPFSTYASFILLPRRNNAHTNPTLPDLN